MKIHALLFFLIGCTLLSCSGIDLIDDFVPPAIRITTPVTTLTIGSNFQFEASYFNNVGELSQGKNLRWESSNPDLLEIDSQGNAIPKQMGLVTITVKVTLEEGNEISAQIDLEIKSNIILIPEETDTTDMETQMPAPPEMETTSSTLVSTVTPTLEISNGIVQITVGTDYTLEINYTDENGDQIQREQLQWESSNSDIISNNQNGNITPLNAGTVSITVSTIISGVLISDTNFINVVNPDTIPTITSFTGMVATTSSYQLEGGFTLALEEGQLILSLDSDYRASRALPGLYVYLSNNRNTTAQALEIGAVTVFEGAHQYTLPSSVGLMDYQYILYWCKPFNVKVGEAKIYD